MDCAVHWCQLAAVQEHPERHEVTWHYPNSSTSELRGRLVYLSIISIALSFLLCLTSNGTACLGHFKAQRRCYRADIVEQLTRDGQRSFAQLKIADNRYGLSTSQFPFILKSFFFFNEKNKMGVEEKRKKIVSAYEFICTCAHMSGCVACV